MEIGDKVEALVNINSHQCRKAGPGQFEEKTRQLFLSHGISAGIAAVQGKAFDATIERVLTRCDILIVAGGDGTVRTAARHMLHTNKVLGILPCGTVNLMARDLKIPLDLPGAVAALASAKPQAVDTAEVNGEPFLCSALIGIFPEISPTRERMRGRPFLLYPAIAWAAVHAITQFPTLRAEIRTPLRNERIRTKALVVSNNPISTKIGEPPFRPRLDTGLLEVHISRNTRTRDMIRLMIRLLLGTWKAEPGLESFQTRALDLAVSASRIKATLDGEIHRLRPPLLFRLNPLSLRVLSPGALR